ncbi:MAG: DMT family transporter [Bacteroidetes bacterium]|nr:DMT family transporter [Bacteroidota bacterium]HET6244174.1 DMT family transporter [Bacteroidia bacterium]
MNINTKTGHWTILLILAFIWGSSFILMKRGLESFSYTQVASLRLFIAFLFLIPFALPHLKMMFGKKAFYIMSVGVIGNGIPAFLFTYAQKGLSSSLTGMLNSLTPLFTLVLGIFVFKSKIKWHNGLGVVVGLTGALGLIAANESNSFNGSFHYASYIILATIFYATSINIIKKHLSEVTSVQIASLALMFVGPFAGIYLFFTDFTTVLFSKPGAFTSLGYVAILAIVGTALSIIVFNILIKMTNAIFASSVTYIIPVFAMLWGIFDNEVISIVQLIWIGIILLGVYLVNTKKEIIKELKLKKAELNLGD